MRPAPGQTPRTCITEPRARSRCRKRRGVPMTTPCGRMRAGRLPVRVRARRPGVEYDHLALLDIRLERDLLLRKRVTIFAHHELDFVTGISMLTERDARAHP